MFRCHDTRCVLGRTSLVLAVVVFVGCQALPTRVEDEYRYRYASPCLRRFPFHALPCRGGSFDKGGGAIERNPTFQGYNPSSKNEHEVWLQQQQQQQQPYEQPLYHQRSSVTSLRHHRQNNPSIISSIRNYFAALHQVSPSLCWTMVSCLVVFGMWQVPRYTRRQNPILSQWFVNSRPNTRHTMGASLIFSSLSHIAPYHLVVNLMALSHFGPRVKRLLQQRNPRSYTTTTTTTSKSDVPLWPLLVSSAVFSNVAQLLLANEPGGGSSLGLSGVTMALSAVQARAEPYRSFGVLLWGMFPISMQADQMLHMWIVVSLLGHLMAPLLRADNNIAHMAHLGGLLFGVAYYEFGIRGSSPLRVVRQWRRHVTQTWQKWV